MSCITSNRYRWLIWLRMYVLSLAATYARCTSTCAWVRILLYPSHASFQRTQMHTNAHAYTHFCTYAHALFPLFFPLGVFLVPCVDVKGGAVLCICYSGVHVYVVSPISADTYMMVCTCVCDCDCKPNLHTSMTPWCGAVVAVTVAAMCLISASFPCCEGAVPTVAACQGYTGPHSWGACVEWAVLFPTNLSNYNSLLNLEPPRSRGRVSFMVHTRVSLATERQKGGRREHARGKGRH